MSYRYTYLSPEPFNESYGSVLIEVEYTPKGPPHDNYGFNPPEGEVCWQFSVFDPIPLKEVKMDTQKRLEQHKKDVKYLKEFEDKALEERKRIKKSGKFKFIGIKQFISKEE